MLAAPDLFFPEFEKVPESKRHLDLRTALYSILRLEFARHASIGCDQFVYWDPTNPRRCLAPDGFVKLGEPDTDFPTWKTWEHAGPPDVAVEIVSSTDTRRWPDKLADYEELGALELVRFNPSAKTGQRLEVWDRQDRTLVTRQVVNETAESHVLDGLRWLLAPVDGFAAALRLARADGSLLLTETEHEAARADAATERADAATERANAAEAELARLRAEIAALKRGG